ncbi:acyltransferase [Dorea longicatena]|uniref:acyltransferase n=1 Tax=Dorea longicatena TaxID=88431 RepID=UPI0036F1BFD0
MINKRNNSYKICIVCVLSIVILVFLYFCKKIDYLKIIYKFAKETKIKDVVNIVAILSGISGVLIGVASIRISNMGAVKEYFQQGDSLENVAARKEIYCKINNNIKIDKNDVAAGSIISFFHFWGLMVKKKYLPLWVFESASGYAVIRLYEGLQEMIEERRKDNEKYGEYFEWLYYKIKKRLKESAKIESHVDIQEQNAEGSSFYTETELKLMGFKEVGQGVQISRNACFYGKKKISIGNHVRIDDFCLLSGNIQIGSYVHISPYTSLVAGSECIQVCDFVSISSKCSIFSKSDDFSGMAMTNPMVPEKYRNVYEGKVILNKHSIIGAGCVVLPDVILGTGGAIGAMSLVNKNVEPWTVCVGIPCKKIRDREQKIKELEQELEKS